MAKKSQDVWEKKPAREDYEAAHDYLTLLFSEARVARIVQRLRAAPTIQREAKDLLRASQTHLLEKDNPSGHVVTQFTAVGEALDHPRRLNQ